MAFARFNSWSLDGSASVYDPTSLYSYSLDRNGNVCRTSGTGFYGEDAMEYVDPAEVPKHVLEEIKKIKARKLHKSFWSRGRRKF